MTIGLIALAVIVVDRASSASPRTSRSRTATSSRPCSSRRTRSGPARRCGSPASTSARSRRSRPTRTTDAAVVVLEINEEGLPIHKDATAKIRPRIFLEGNFFVDLKPASPAAPVLDDGGTLGHADRDAGAARPGADRAAVRHAAGPPGRAQQPRVRSTRSRRAAEDRDADPSARGETAAESLNDAYDDIRTPSARPRIVRGASSAPSPTATCRGCSTARAHDRRAGPQRERAAGPDHELQHHDGGVRRRVGQPAARRSASSRPRWRPPTARSPRSTRRSRPRARSRGRSSPACARRRRRSRRLSRGSTRRASCGPERARRAGEASCRRPAATSRRLTDACSTCCRRPTCVMRARRAAADRRRRDRGRVRDRRRELQGVLVRDGRARGRGPELRRQRHVRALPDRRRRADHRRSARPRRARRAVRQRRRRAARQPPVYPGKQPPYKPDVPCHKQTLPNLNGPAAAKSAPTARPRWPPGRRCRELRAKLRPFGPTKDGAE